MQNMRSYFYFNLGTFCDEDACIDGAHALKIGSEERCQNTYCDSQNPLDVVACCNESNLIS